MSENDRKIALDTETTGLDAKTGDRIVEIGAVELINDIPSGRKLHLYINPERDVPREAVKVHGLTNAFLDDKPVFAKVADEFLAFVGDAKLVIHNAKFDIGFLDAELEKAGRPPLGIERAVDTMDISRRRFPGSPLTLDALCRRLGVPLEGRELHGALLDAELLGEVWLCLNGGRQPEMALGAGPQTAQPSGRAVSFGARQRPRPLTARVSADEEAAHQSVMRSIDETARKATKGEKGAIWEPTPAEGPSP